MNDRTAADTLRGLLYLACPEAPDGARREALTLLVDTDRQLLDDEAAALTARLNESAERSAPVDLRRVDLRGADLRKADLHRANLTRANLRGADLRKADLHRADLTRANLRGADLRKADLHRADLTRANLRGADLRHADLRHAHWVPRPESAALTATLAMTAAGVVAPWLIPMRAALGVSSAVQGASVLRDFLDAFEGVKWSTETRWPRAWPPIMRAMSTPISPTSYRIHSRKQEQPSHMPMT
ncbi:pentapeptide repeat-containing protein [Streptomyces chartreusis]